MNALDRLVRRCNEMDITEQLNWLGDASMPYQAQLELAALRAENERLTARLQAAEGVAEQALRRMWVYHVDIDGVPDEYLQTFRDRYKVELAAALQAEGEAKK